MHEIELKFLIPQARLKGLMRQAKVKNSCLTYMAAHYYDTSKRELAKAGIGLRIRQEGDNWVQTIKAGGDGIAARLEHNALLDNEQVQIMLDNNALMPDLSIYKDTSIAPALANFKLKKLAKKLTRQYVTDVQRITRLLKDEEKSANILETAYDKGHIIHGNDDTQRQPIQEIEFEWVSGELDFLFTTAKTWCKRYQLCLSTVTKAERGNLLLQGIDYSPAVDADLAQLDINKDSSMAVFIRAVVHNCLLQILPNSSAIVAGSEDNDHILQLRIGIRRLRTALKSFEKFSDQLDPKWLPILKQTATLLGDYRVLANLATYIQPMLEQQGAPVIDWEAEVAAIKVTPMNAVSATDFQLTLLELIAFTMSDASTEAQANKLAYDKLPKILSKQYSKCLNAEHKVADLGTNELNADDYRNKNSDSANMVYQAQHKLRRQLRNMRYLSEFTAPLYSKKKSKRFLKALIKAQQSLGQYSDDNQYQQCYQQKSLIYPNALYGAGWFASTSKTDAKRCKKRLAKVQRCTVFW